MDGLKYISSSLIASFPWPPFPLQTQRQSGQLPVQLNAGSVLLRRHRSLLVRVRPLRRAVLAVRGHHWSIIVVDIK